MTQEAAHPQGEGTQGVYVEPALIRGYAAAFDAYRRAGWESVLPLPPRKKSAPPSGYTGRDARSPSYPDLMTWAEEYPAGNICLRLPENVIGLDVDHYDGKDGGGTLQRHVDAYGELPPTWRTTSRTDGVSGIRLYRVPPGLQWPGELGGGIEIIQARHRYAMVGPSIHPNGGTYHWIHDELCGASPGHVPRVEDLPYLPDAWITGLTEGRTAQNIQAADLGAQEARAWLEAHGRGQLCRLMAEVATEYAADLAAGRGESRHGIATKATHRIARLIGEGHPGGLMALRTVRSAFAQAATDRKPQELNSEWDRALIGAVRIAATAPAEPDDPCDNPFHGLLSNADYLRAIAWTEPRQTTAVPGLAAPSDAAGAVGEAFPALDWRARWDAPQVEEWIVEPLLPARRLVALYSPPKTGKSLLMLELAAAVATGREVLGTSPGRPRRVLYVDFENDPDSDVIPRLKAMGYRAEELDNLSYLSFPTMAALDSERGSLELVAALDHYQCEVVVVDTVSRAVAGLENENDTWLNFYRHTGLKLKQRGVSLVRLDHTGKDETKGQRGGSAKGGDVDAVWRLSTVLKDKTYRLDCEMNRMPVNEKTLVLERISTPVLRHKVAGGGKFAAYQSKIEALVDSMNAAGDPPDAGRSYAEAAKERLGLTASKSILEEAVRVRKQRRGVPIHDTLPEV